MSAAWTLYQPTAIADADAHCIAMGHPGINYDYGSTFPTTQASCSNWAVGGPRIIGVQLNTAQSQEGYCCYDSTTTISGPTTSYTKEGNQWGSTIQTYQTSPVNGGVAYTLGANITYDTTAPYRYTKAGTGGSSATPTSLCDGLTTQAFFDCLHDWTDSNTSVGATVHGQLVRQAYSFPSYTFCNGITISPQCPAKQKITSITDPTYGTFSNQLPDYSTVANNGPYGMSFPCVHAAKTYKLSYCFQCAKT
jgi:hypothetical protein